MRIIRSRPAVPAAILASAALLVGSGCALAATPVAPSDAPRMVLHYDARSLDNPQGLHALYRRIRVAAEQVCPDAPFDTLHRNAAVQACRAQAVERAVQAIGSSRLAELHAAKLKQG